MIHYVSRCVNLSRRIDLVAMSIMKIWFDILANVFHRFIRINMGELSRSLLRYTKFIWSKIWTMKNACFVFCFIFFSLYPVDHIWCTLQIFMETIVKRRRIEPSAIILNWFQLMKEKETMTERWIKFNFFWVQWNSSLVFLFVLLVVIILSCLIS